MNEFQNEVYIQQKKGVWYVLQNGDKIPYFDGIHIKNGKVLNPN